MLNPPEVRPVVLDELRDVFEEGLADISEITGTEQLSELELNSLDLARLIIRLEAAVGTDPFAGEQLAISDIRTVDALVRAYEDAVTTPLVPAETAAS
jgi:acyl carrier protein